MRLGNKLSVGEVVDHDAEEPPVQTNAAPGVRPVHVDTPIEPILHTDTVVMANAER
ncbi:MAG: hypothetical protein JO100_18345 [Pseudonocardia sp.]|nr:hypothetical protein [Pseudonocardia sp.]